MHMHLYMASDLPLHMHLYMSSDLRCQEGVHPLWLVVHVHRLLERAKKGYTLS